MKKFVPLMLVLALLLLATAVVSADVPPGVALAFRVDPDDTCWVQYSDGDATYEGIGRTQYSNGATGHSTYKCKLELVSGTPGYYLWEFSFDNCDTTILRDGKKGMWTTQCSEDWYP